MSVVIIVTGALVFFALIMASIALHEIGHLLPAKLFDVKVTQYFVGFGRTLKSWRRGETEYGFKAIPLGGYVRLIGMYPPARQGAKASRLQRLADGARSYEYEEITPADDGRLFYQKPTWQKLIIMFGGPLMNIVLAFVIFLGVNAAWGQYRPQLDLVAVSECVVPQSRAEKVCQPGDPQSPAKRAGLEVGDRVVSFNGTTVSTWDEFSELIRDNLDHEANIVVDRGGRQITTTTQTIITGMPDRLDPAKTVEVGFLGVTPAYERVRSGPVQTVQDMWRMTQQSAVALASFPVKVWNVGGDLVTGKPRDINGPLSIVGASRVAGELAVQTDMKLGDKVSSWFMLLGSVNLFVALLNLVPLLPLDGGHMLGAIYEWFKRMGARLFRRPDPGHVDTAKMLPVAYVVGGFLLLAGVVLILADIISPLKIF